MVTLLTDSVQAGVLAAWCVVVVFPNRVVSVLLTRCWAGEHGDSMVLVSRWQVKLLPLLCNNASKL